MKTVNEKKQRWKKKILHELVDYWLAVLYMAIFFSIFSNYQRLILAHYGIIYTEYGISVIKALVLAKVVLVAETLRVGRGFEDKPLVVPTLYKTFLFTLCVGVFNIAEGLARALIKGLGLMGAVDEVMSGFNYVWLARAMVVFFSFIPFFMVRELGRVLGEGTIAKLFFSGDQSERQALMPDR